MRVRANAGFGITGPRAYSRGTSGTPESATPLTRIVSDEAGPQFPAASRPRTQSFWLPRPNEVVMSEALTSAVAPPNPPDMAMPVPAGAGEAPNHHSAWTTAEPPARRSVSVAVSVA